MLNNIPPEYKSVVKEAKHNGVEKEEALDWIRHRYKKYEVDTLKQTIETVYRK